MAGYRAGRMSEDIRRIISGKMRDLKDPRIHGGDMLTIVRCDVAGDGSFCKVYVSSFEGYEKAKEAVKGFESATGFLKREISNVLKLKKCPELKFILEKKLEEKQNKYKKIISVSNDKIDKYIDNKVDLDKKLKDDGDIYYYKVVNKGLFKKKEVYIINMYTEKVYLIDNDSIKDY